MGPAGLKEKKKYKSEIQMRRLNWKKVNQATDMPFSCLLPSLCHYSFQDHRLIKTHSGFMQMKRLLNPMNFSMIWKVPLASVKVSYRC